MALVAAAQSYRGYQLHDGLCDSIDHQLLVLYGCFLLDYHAMITRLAMTA